MDMLTLLSYTGTAVFALQGFFQPIAGLPFPGSATGLPRHVELLHSVFSLRCDPKAMLGVSR
jgi:hypothetical protein